MSQGWTSAWMPSICKCVFAPSDRCSFLLAAAIMIFKQMEKASENDSEGSERAGPGVRHAHTNWEHTQNIHFHMLLSIRWPAPERSEGPPGEGHAAPYNLFVRGSWQYHEGEGAAHVETVHVSERALARCRRGEELPLVCIQAKTVWHLFNELQQIVSQRREKLLQKELLGKYVF